MSEEYIGWLDDDWNTVLDMSQPIVRCKDCKYLIPRGACEYWDYCDVESMDGFCAWGEPKVVE